MAGTYQGVSKRREHIKIIKFYETNKANGSGEICLNLKIEISEPERKTSDANWRRRHSLNCDIEEGTVFSLDNLCGGNFRRQFV